LLVDVDTVAPSIGQHLGLVDDTSGLAAAARAAAHGGLTPSLLSSLVVSVPSGMAVLVGLPSGDRWTELRAASIENVIACARKTFDHIVLDVGHGTEGDDLAWAESASPERYGAARTTLRSADVLMCVCRLDPISLVRFIKAVPAARDLAPTATTLVVANCYEAVRDRPATAIVAESLGLMVSARIPNDPKTLSRALGHGKTVREQKTSRGSLIAAYDRLADAVESFSPSYDVQGGTVSRTHRRLLRSAHRRHRHRDAGLV
jgi:MinD-like ATPase involved in chromosome partitioning or flagellar assembly